MRARDDREGFTLIELMIVVAIIGILAAIAIPTFSSYVYKSRTAEATTFLGEIRMRQESYRAEFGNYADIGVGTWTPASPPPVGAVQTWPVVPAWNQLGARPDGPVRFQYEVFAGGPGGANPPAATGLPNNDFWFVAHARADLDGDKGGGACGGESDMECIFFEVLSHTNRVWVNQSQGWE